MITYEAEIIDITRHKGKTALRVQWVNKDLAAKDGLGRGAVLAGSGAEVVGDMVAIKPLMGQHNEIYGLEIV